jgi:hypothetical protein
MACFKSLVMVIHEDWMMQGGTLMTSKGNLHMRWLKVALYTYVYPICAEWIDETIWQYKFVNSMFLFRILIVLRMDQQRKAELLQKELFASFQKENMYIYIYILIYVYVVQCVRIRGVYLYMLYNVYAYVGIRAVLKDD